MKYKLAYLVSAIIALAIVFIGRNNVVRFFVGEPSHKVSLPVVQSEFSKFKIYDGDRWTEQPISFDKVSIDGVKGYLRSNASSSEIIDYYKSSARALGWSEADVEKRRDGDRSIEFCKNGVSFVIEVLGGSGRAGIDYYLALTWTDDAGLDSYCPPSGKI